MATFYNAPHQRRIQKNPGFSVLSTEENISQGANLDKLASKDLPKRSIAKPRRALGDVSNTAKIEGMPSALNITKIKTPMAKHAANWVTTQNTVKAEKTYLNLKTLVHSEVYPDSDDYDDIWPQSERISADVIGQFKRPSNYLRIGHSSEVKDDVAMPAIIPDSSWDRSCDVDNSNPFDSPVNAVLLDDSPMLPVDFMDLVDDTF